MPEKLRRFSMRLRLAAREKVSEAMRQVVGKSGKPVVAIPDGPDGQPLPEVPGGTGRQRAAPLRLLRVQAKSGASYPLVVGEPVRSKSRRS